MYWFAQVSDPHIVRLGVELILNWHFFLRCQLSSRSMSSRAHHSTLFPLCHFPTPSFSSPILLKRVREPIGKTTMNVSIHEDIREHLCWRKLCLHSLHPEANTTQSRQFGFVKKSSREVCNYTRSTLLNNWVTSLQKVSHVSF